MELIGSIISGLFFTLLAFAILIPFLWIFWIAKKLLFDGMRGPIITLVLFFYIIGFPFLWREILFAKDLENALIFVLLLGVAFVIPMFVVIGIPVLLFIKSGRQAASGLNDIKEKRTVEDIPTSLIGTGAVGSQVEIKGALVAKKQMFEGDADTDRHWRIPDEAFFLSNGAGSYALIDPTGAQLLMDPRSLVLNAEIYVKGYAESGSSYQKRPEAVDWLNKSMRLIQSNPDLKKRFDTDGDGDLDAGELKRGAEILSQELKIKTLPGMLADTKMVFKNSLNHPLIITNMKESELTGHIQMRSGLKMAVSMGLLVLAVVFFVGRISSCSEMCDVTMSGIHCSAHSSWSLQK